MSPRRAARPDTISALATPEGRGGVAVVRISGPRTYKVLDRCFRSPAPSRQPAGTVRLRWFRAGAEPLDQVLLSVFRRPRSYTGEDMAEISCHGGGAVARSVLARLERLGCRTAQPGEFTRRAVLAGKLSLSQAEAVLQLADARSEPARQRALRAYAGAVGRFAAGLRRRLDAVHADIEYRIGFEDENSPVTGTPGRTIAAVAAELDRVVAEGRAAARLEQGLSVAIIGRSNAGKSSLFNALLASDRAIVAPAAGTTRDRVEAALELGETVVKLTDTAGWSVRARTGLGRAASVQTARAVEVADALIAVFDSSRPAGPADRAALDACSGRPHLLVLNKSDLKSRFNAALPGRPIRTSSYTGQGIAAVRRRIARWGAPAHADALTTVDRHLRVFAAAAERLTATGRAPGLDAAALEIRAAAAMLAQVDAPPLRTDILNEVFKRFCVGK